MGECAENVQREIQHVTVLMGSADSLRSGTLPSLSVLAFVRQDLAAEHHDGHLCRRQKLKPTPDKT
jgi:hypothetical protein